MYIFTTFELPTYNFNFHLLTTSVNAKYYYESKNDLVGIDQQPSTHNLGFGKLTKVVSSLVTVIRNMPRPRTASQLYILGVTCINNFFMVLLYDGLCTSNMFIVFQVIVLLSYTSYILCVAIYLNIKIYLKTYRGVVVLTNTQMEFLLGCQV